MAITPSSSNKESTSSTNSIVMETFQKVSSDTTAFSQHVLNNQKNAQQNHTSRSHSIISHSTVNNHKSNTKGINVRQEVDNTLPMGHHHFSLQSLLEALPSASVSVKKSATHVVYVYVLFLTTAIQFRKRAAILVILM